MENTPVGFLGSQLKRISAGRFVGPEGHVCLKLTPHQTVGVRSVGFRGICPIVVSIDSRHWSGGIGGVFVDVDVGVGVGVDMRHDNQMFQAWLDGTMMGTGLGCNGVGAERS